MKKKNNLTSAVVLMLIITLLALIALASTYAKYTTSASGTGTAIIGKWDIDFKNGESELSDQFKIDLADTMTSADSTNEFIQPGSTGEFTITIKNNGQVPATITAQVTDSSSTIFKKGQFTLTPTGTTEEGGAVVDAGSTKDITVEWSWTYDSSTDADTDDTTLGINSTGTESTVCEIEFTATQVDPNA